MHDPAGEVYGKLTVLAYTDKVYKNRDKFVSAKCTCGVVKEYRYPSLKNPKGSRSCGCMRWLGTHNMTGTALYRSWAHMHRRCYTPSNDSYYNYGARGIKVAKRWHSFENFQEDMEGTHQAGLILDRIDNSKGYSKFNCRWVTRAKSNANLTSNLTVIYEGKYYCFAEICRQHGKAPYSTALHRLRQGKAVADAIKCDDPSKIFWMKES